MKTLPPLVTLDAGEASGHRRRVLCITSCSLLSSPEFIVVSISRASILVVSNFASLSDPIAASLAPPLVTAASPVLLLVTTHTLTASRKARSRRLIGSARCFVSTVTPLGVFLPPELAIRHPVSSPVGTLELLVRNPLRRIPSNGTLGMGFHFLISGLWISSGSNERNRSRYGNIGALALSLASDPIPLLNIAKRLSSPRSGSEQYSVLINLTQRFSISSIPATPRVIRSSKHTEPAIPTDVVLACYHPFTLYPHPQQNTPSKLSSAVLSGICPLMISLIQLGEIRCCLVSVTLWPRHGNVGSWSQSVNSTTGGPSSLVRCLPQVLKFKEIKSSWPVIASNTQRKSETKGASTVSLSSLPNNLLSGMFEIHIVSRVSIVGVRAYCVRPLFLNSSAKYGQIRPFSIVLVYGSGVIPQLLLQANSSLIICKTDAMWNKDRKTAGLGWVFSGQALEFPIHGSLRQSYIRSSLAATSALFLVLILEFSTLKVFSNNSTLVRAISSSLQSKEIIVVKDIRSISSGFASICFCNFSKNALVDVLAKRLFKPSYLYFCNGLQELGHLWTYSLLS